MAGVPAQALRDGHQMIEEMLPQAERIAAVLKARKETVSVAESSTAGLISAALLSVAGASAYFMGGAVVYTRASRTELLRVTEEEFAALTGITPSTEPYAMLFARKIRERLRRPGRSARPAPRARPAAATGMRRGIPALRSWDRSSARPRSRPAAPTGSPTCARLPWRRSTCWSKASARPDLAA